MSTQTRYTSTDNTQKVATLSEPPDYSAYARRLSVQQLISEHRRASQTAEALAQQLAHASLPLGIEDVVAQAEMRNCWAMSTAIEKECRRRRVSLPVKN
ncbi:MAG: hypothetical protein F6J87_30025 [Spirulina sp. SIO3F2]|nr:hypothetical protein [Spirulina sp. SIO3F2]